MTDHFYDDGEYQENDSPIVGCLVGFAALVGVGGLGWLVFWLVGLM